MKNNLIWVDLSWEDYRPLEPDQQYMDCGVFCNSSNYITAFHELVRTYDINVNQFLTKHLGALDMAYTLEKDSEVILVFENYQYKRKFCLMNAELFFKYVEAEKFIFGLEIKITQS